MIRKMCGWMCLSGRKELNRGGGGQGVTLTNLTASWVSGLLRFTSLYISGLVFTEREGPANGRYFCGVDSSDYMHFWKLV